ncbi:MAG: hypothetical protein HFE67_05975, partial [Erysipelotrichaceae bacterium]|nr:hypothetical protein [Erysipelotrichaceae bacterium]
GIPDENIKEITEWKPTGKAGEVCTMIPSDPNDPDDQDDSDPSGKPNGEVQGSYYPGDNVGGALTGDTSNSLLYMSITFASFGILCFLWYKHKNIKSK